MDHSYPYIASLTREPFLFYEMRSTAKLMAEGNPDARFIRNARFTGCLTAVRRMDLRL